MDARGGIFLVDFYGAIGQQYPSLRFQGQPSPSQLAAFNAVTASTISTTADTDKAKIYCQMEALTLEHKSLEQHLWYGTFWDYWTYL